MLTLEEYALENHSSVEEFIKACSATFDFQKAMKHKDGFQDNRFNKLIEMINEEKEIVKFPHQYNYYGYSTIMFDSNDFYNFVNIIYNKLVGKGLTKDEIICNSLMRRFTGVSLEDISCRSHKGNQIVFRSHILKDNNQVTCFVVWTFFEEDIDEIINEFLNL